MQVAVGAGHLEIDVEDALRAHVDPRILLDVFAARLPQTPIGFDEVLVLPDKLVQVLGGGLLFALHHELHSQRQRPAGLQPRLDGGQPRDQVALVVRHTARVEFAVADLRRKRG